MGWSHGNEEDDEAVLSLELRERAVRLVREHEAEHGSQWAAIRSIAERMECIAETLRLWVATFAA